MRQHWGHWSVAQGLVSVLKPIIDTIDRFGLKHYFLNKHHADVERFFRQLETADYQSDVARKYHKRMCKYRGKLFVFLPGTNKNAETAIKGYFSRRKLLGAGFTEKGIQDYLIFLSIYQTCRRQGVSFLRFLRFGGLDLEAFVDGRRLSGASAGH